MGRNKKKAKKQSWALYVIRCGDDSLYTGITTDVARRFDEHKSGRGAKYTRGRGPFTLLRTWKFEDRSEASKAEYAFKQLPRKKKLEKINEDI